LFQVPSNTSEAVVIDGVEEEIKSKVAEALTAIGMMKDALAGTLPRENTLHLQVPRTKTDNVDDALVRYANSQGGSQ
jgi:hypothetical protein